MRIVQLQHPGEGRRVAVVEGNRLHLLEHSTTLYACAIGATYSHASLIESVRMELEESWLDYDPIYAGQSEWRLLPPFDHPDEPARCLVTGTGLTHRQGAANRNAMHQAKSDQPVTITDSMKIYEWGAENGRPAPGEIGVQPEWFYKGCGTGLRAHGEPLEVPAYAEDGGEEAEIAGVYLIDRTGRPRRLGFVVGNEFSDHVMERRNYLYLAPSKLRACAIGPELVLNADFQDVQGTVSIERDDQVIWSHAVSTGEAHMVHSLANLEHHHFKYEGHRRSGDVHIHFFGTGAFSFGAGVNLQNGDTMVVDVPTFGRALRNSVHLSAQAPAQTVVEPL